MSNTITAAADYVRPWLFADPPVTGAVHSVYRGAVNLIFDYHVAALQPEGSPVSPITLTAGCPLDSLNLKLNTPVTIGRGQIRFQNKKILKAAPGLVTVPTHLKPSPLTFSELAERSQAVFARCADPGMGFYPLFKAPYEPRDLISEAMKAHLDAVIEAFRNKDWNLFAERLVGLSGMGQGLTPSGDDFLCGMFAAAKGIGGPWDRHPATVPVIGHVEDMCRRTHPLSAAFLTCAAEGFVSETLIAFFHTPKAAFDPQKMAAAFEAIGHSSGIDTLCGILFVQYLLTPALKK